MWHPFTGGGRVTALTPEPVMSGQVRRLRCQRGAEGHFDPAAESVKEVAKHRPNSSWRC
ncbi:protein of unknown function [Kyrpidia spormannii]|uniref:Uncharacterized protein n=1 Tax=Kyrpidia spormannii TaxID=2055160 RepID=A0A6F9EGY0_9BACL|nr:protein of unknown function [Kyrpidia spormannii]